MHKMIPFLATIAVATLVLLAVLVDSGSSSTVTPLQLDTTVEHADRSHPIWFEPEILPVAGVSEGVESVDTGRVAESTPVAARENEREAEEWFPERVIMAEEGDTAYSLALRYYGTRRVFRMIVDANPDLPWQDRLEAKMIVVLPEYDAAVLGD